MIRLTAYSVLSHQKSGKGSGRSNTGHKPSPGPLRRSWLAVTTLLGVLVLFLGWNALWLDSSIKASSQPQITNAQFQNLVPLDGIAQVAAGGSHTCALTTTGGVKCWGDNENGQLGDGSITNRTTPVDVAELGSGVAALAAGGGHTCALSTTGGVKCWGDNGNGQLGDGTMADKSSPVEVVGLGSGVAAIAASGWHTCALSTAGGVKCWGWNSSGQLGDGTTADKSTPVAVVGLGSGVAAIATGDWHTCALSTAGGVKCWGDNSIGQLGDGTTAPKSSPVAVLGLGSGVAAIAVGYAHTCALTTGGGVKCWGNNGIGQLGDGTTANKSSPVDVAELGSGVAALAAGVWHTCALTSAGGVKCWGYNWVGQLGDGTMGNKSTPVDVVGLGSGVAAIAAGGLHTCALSTTGGVKCWGRNNFGQLGDDTTVDKSTPVDVLMQEATPTPTRTNTSTPTPTHTSTRTPTATSTSTPTSSIADTYEPDDTCEQAKPIVPESPPQERTLHDDIDIDWARLEVVANHRYQISVHSLSDNLNLSIYSECSDQPPDDFVRNGLAPSITIRIGFTAPYTGIVYLNVAASENTTENGPIQYQLVVSNLPGDLYEPDNTCAQAQPLPLAGLPQERTFHKAADVDWAVIETVAGQRYRISAYVPDGSLADVVMEPYTACDDPFGEPWNEPFAREAVLEFDALTTGPVYIRLTNNDAAVGGSHVRYSLSARSLVEDKTGAVILVGGRYRTSDNLQSNINRVINDVHELFLAKGYTEDDIQVLAADSRDIPGWDRSATVANLRWAITTWAVSRIGPDRALTLYMMDHGDRNAFFLDNPYSEVLTPTQLKGWLNQLETAVPGVKINVVIEACYAGSFIEGTDSISKAGRLIITSTSADNSAYASNTGANFSDRFLVGLWQNKDVFVSFAEAQASVQRNTSIQDPWLDGDGNGIPNELDDMLIARERGFHNPGSFDDRWPPLIYTAKGPEQIANRQGIIEAEVRTPPYKQIQSVWAVLYPPSYTPPPPGAELIPELDSSLPLTHQGNGIYQVNYAGFDEAGLYRIVIHAQDLDGLTARPVVLEVQNSYPLFLPQLQK